MMPFYSRCCHCNFPWCINLSLDNGDRYFFLFRSMAAARWRCRFFSTHSDSDLHYRRHELFSLLSVYFLCHSFTLARFSYHPPPLSLTLFCSLSLSLSLLHLFFFLLCIPPSCHSLPLPQLYCFFASSHHPCQFVMLQCMWTSLSSRNLLTTIGELKITQFHTYISTE